MLLSYRPRQCWRPPAEAAREPLACRRRRRPTAEAAAAAHRLDRRRRRAGLTFAAVPAGTGVQRSRAARRSPKPSTAWVVGAAPPRASAPPPPPGRGLASAGRRRRRRPGSESRRRSAAGVDGVVVGRCNTTATGRRRAAAGLRRSSATPHGAAKTFPRAQIATHEGVSARIRRPPRPTERVRGAPEPPPTPVTDSAGCANVVRRGARRESEAARIVAAPSVSPPSRDWAKTRWNPASPSKQSAPATPPSGARQWAPAPVESDDGRDARGHARGSARRRRRPPARVQVGPESVEPLYDSVVLGGRRHCPNGGVRWSTPPPRLRTILGVHRRRGACRPEMPSDAIAATHRVAPDRDCDPEPRRERERADEAQGDADHQARGWRCYWRRRPQVQKTVRGGHGPGRQVAPRALPRSVDGEDGTRLRLTRIPVT